jgi:hypothetical protein
LLIAALAVVAALTTVALAMVGVFTFGPISLPTPLGNVAGEIPGAAASASDRRLPGFGIVPVVPIVPVIPVAPAVPVSTGALVGALPASAPF